MSVSGKRFKGDNMLKFVKRLLISLLILVILAGLALFIPSVQNSLKNFILQKINLSTAQNIKIGSMSNILSNRVELRDVEIRWQNVFIACPRINLSYNPFFLLFGYLHINTVEADNLQVKIINNMVNKIVSWPTTAKKPFLKNINIRKIILKSAQWQSNVGENSSIEIKEINAVLALHLDLETITAKVQLINLQCQSVNPAFEIKKAMGQITYIKDQVELSELIVNLPRTSLYLEGSLKDFSSPTVYLRVRANPLDLRDFVATSKKLAHYRPAKIELTMAGKLSRLNYGLKVNYGSSHSSWHGLIDLAGTKKHSFTIEGKVENLNLADFNATRLPQNTSLNLQLSGTGKAPDWKNLHTNLKINILDSYYGPYQIFPSTLICNIDQDEVSLKTDNLNTNFGQFSLDSNMTMTNVALGLDKAYLHLKFSQLNIKPLIKEVYLGSSLNGNFSLRVDDLSWRNWLKADIVAELNISASELARVKVDDLIFKGSLVKEKLNIDKFLLKSDLAESEIKGTIDFNNLTDVDFWVKGKDVSLLSNILATKVFGGQFTLKGNMGGYTKNPQFSWDISGTDLKYNQYSVSDLVSKGTYFEKFFDFEVNLNNDRGVKIGLKGTTNIKDLPVNTEIELVNIQYADIFWTNARKFSFKIGPGYLAIQDMFVGSRGQVIGANGILDQKGSFDFKVSSENVNLELLNIFFPSSLGLTGTLNGMMIISGNAANPVLNSRLELNNLQIPPVSFSKVNVDLDYGQGQWRLVSKAKYQDREPVEVEGYLRWPLNFDQKISDIWLSQLDFKVKVDRLPYALLQNLIPTVERSSGYINAYITAKGHLSAPVVRITASTDDFILKVNYLNEPFQSLLLKANIINNRVTLDYLIAKTKRGEIKISGDGRNNKFNLESFNLNLKINNGPLGYPGIFSALVNAEGNFTKEKNKYILQAKVEPLEGLIEIKKTWQQTKTDIVYIDEMEDSKSKTNEQQSKTFLDQLFLDIKIHSNGNLWYKQGTSKAEIIGDLRFLKQYDRPLTYLGNIKIKQGYYDFFENRFTVTKGTLNFPGTPGFNPSLDIEAEYTQLTEFKIIATVRGDLNHPLIQLRSEPPQRDVEILSYLLFGKSSTNLSQQEASSVQNQVVSFLGRTTVLKVRDILGKKLSIDTLDITRHPKTQGWQVAVGKYVGRRLFVSYTFGFSPEAEDKLRLEYKLGRRWNVESEISQRHSAGADLFWTIDY